MLTPKRIKTVKRQTSPELSSSDESNPSVTQHDARINTTGKIMTTTVACIAGAFVTYPAEMYRESFTTKTLGAWYYDGRSTVGSTSSRGISAFFEQKQKARLVISPLFRLVSHEVALSITNAMFTRKTDSSTMLTNSEDTGGSNGIMLEMISGAVAGTSQALLLCPLEAHRANRLKIAEEREVNSWVQWTRSQLFAGGTVDPRERLIRVYRGVGILAAREILFNVSFFPLFHGLRRYFNSCENFVISPPTASDHYKRNVSNTFASGVLSGAICSLVVTPMDLIKTYLMHSREKWSFWSGTRVFAPPLKLLSRGLILQAFVFGPTFGVVAATYELI